MGAGSGADSDAGDDAAGNEAGSAASSLLGAPPGFTATPLTSGQPAPHVVPPMSGMSAALLLPPSSPYHGIIEELTPRWAERKHVWVPDSDLVDGNRITVLSWNILAEYMAVKHARTAKLTGDGEIGGISLVEGGVTIEELFDEFRAYKGKIPVCGCVLLDPSLTKVVLVQNWAKTSWGLPKGKLNQNERKSECAKREVGEETGYDVLMDLDENEALELVNQDQHAAMFCVPDVDPSFDFQPRVRKEISNVKFFPLDQLPAKQWGVGQFVPKIKRWVKQYKKKRKGLPIVEDDTPPASPSRPVPPPLSPSQVERSLEASASCDRIMKAFDDALAPHLEAARRELEEALVEAEASYSNGHSPETDLEPTPPPRPGGGGWAAPGASTTKRKKKTKLELPRIPTEDMALFQRWVPFWHDSLTTKPTKEEFYRLPGYGDLSARQAIGLDQYECKNVNKNLRADTIAQLFQTYLVHRGRRHVEQYEALLTKTLYMNREKSMGMLKKFERIAKRVEAGALRLPPKPAGAAAAARASRRRARRGAIASASARPWPRTTSRSTSSDESAAGAPRSRRHARRRRPGRFGGAFARLAR